MIATQQTECVYCGHVDNTSMCDPMAIMKCPSCGRFILVANGHSAIRRITEMIKEKALPWPGNPAHQQSYCDKKAGGGSQKQNNG